MTAVSVKEFASLTEARGFAGNQGVLSHERYEVTAGVVRLHWRRLEVSVFGRAGEGFSRDRRYSVMRETPGAYIVRDDGGRAVKIDRGSRMAGKVMFTIH